MNDGYIATGTASAEGRVAFSIQAGVRPGDYRIRLEQMGAADSVVSRAEMPFRAPATVAAAAPSASPAPTQSTGSCRSRNHCGRAFRPNQRPRPRRLSQRRHSRRP